MVFGALGPEEAKGKRGEKAEGDSGDERMEVFVMHGKIGGRTEVRAEEVDVGDRAGENDGQSGGAGEAREDGALHSVRGQGVGEWIHRGEVIS